MESLLQRAAADFGRRTRRALEVGEVFALPAHAPATLCIVRIALNAADLRTCSG